MDETTAGGLAVLLDGGPILLLIGILSVATLALILWKLWSLIAMGAFSRGATSGVRATFAQTIEGLRDTPAGREEATRHAKRHLAEAQSGLRALEFIATIAPLLGLLGTVLGMIAAFQALQDAGGQADPATLAGGIWEALLTTAAGMAVAIPASAALTWFEGIVDRLRLDLEDNATRLFLAKAA